MSKVTLDAETFRALASSTRLSVLRALDERRKTLSELARGLDLNKATLHEHLQLLSAADLVRKRDDEGRKWIYYELTWRGQRLLHPQETTTFNVLLSLGVLAAGGGVTMLGKTLGWWLQEKALQNPDDLNKAFGAQLTQTNESADTAAGSTASSPAPAASESPPASPASPASPAPSATGDGAMDAYASGMHDRAADDSTATTSDDSFWGDNTWIGLALLACTTLFGILAYKLRRKIRPGAFQPPANPEDT